MKRYIINEIYSDGYERIAIIKEIGKDVKINVHFLEYDEYLRGTKAVYKVNDDYSLTMLSSEKPGNDLYLSIDIDLQLKIEQIVENKKESDIQLNLVELTQSGGTYKIHSTESQFETKELWLCNVTKFVFGEHPEEIFVKIIW